MVFTYLLSCILLYVVGIVGSSVFYQWANQNLELWELDHKPNRFILSLFWFITVPIYFLCSLVVFFFEGIWKFYSFFD